MFDIVRFYKERKLEVGFCVLCRGVFMLLLVCECVVVFFFGF